MIKMTVSKNNRFRFTIFPKTIMNNTFNIFCSIWQSGIDQEPFTIGVPDTYDVCYLISIIIYILFYLLTRATVHRGHRDKRVMFSLLSVLIHIISPSILYFLERTLIKK